MIYTKEWAFIHIPKTSGTNFQIRMEDKEGVTNAYKDLPDREFIVENEKKRFEISKSTSTLTMVVR